MKSVCSKLGITPEDCPFVLIGLSFLGIWVTSIGKVLGAC